MADIILAGDSFSLKKLQSAADKLEDAQNLMQQVYDAVFSTSFWAEANPFALLDGDKNMNVFDGTIDELRTCQQRVRQKEENLRTLTQRMEAAVRELAEADQSFSGKLSGESNAKRAWNGFWESIATASKIASTPAIPLLAAIGRLFHSDSAVAGETPIEVPVQKKIRFTDDEIETIYGEFDWRGISVTDEEKMAIVRRASDKWELHLLFEKLYNEKLDAMPPTEIRITNYADGAAVEAGKIRYVNQSESGNFAANGWGKYGSDSNKASPEGECCTACQSMALSYLGIDASPEKLLDTGKHMEMTGAESGYNGEFVRGSDDQATIYANRWNYDDFAQSVDKFENDKNRGITSPVIIRYDGGHFIMIVGRGEEEGTYRAIGPWGGQSGTWERDNLIVRIDSSGRISNVGTNCSSMQHGESWNVEHFQQYTKV